MDKIAVKIVDSFVVVGALVVSVASIRGIISGVKLKSTTAIVLSSLTLLIGAYAIKGASDSLSEKSKS